MPLAFFTSSKRSKNNKMGCGASKVDPNDKDAVLQNEKIEKQIKIDRKEDERTVKILLLGAGESGKSTIIKQMRIIHSKGFEHDERVQMKAVIYANILEACRVLMEIMNDGQISYSKDSTRQSAAILDQAETEIHGEQAFTNPQINKAMLDLWSDDGVQRAIVRGHEYALNDNLQYYRDNIDRIFEPNWIPNDQDMLRARLRTTGITETVFDMRQLVFRMMDVGGQRSERKKWIHCFEGVQCLLFMAALSGYDQCLVEDADANQMHEALMLFETLVNGAWFKDKPIILFLNKIDLFKDKLKQSPISTHFTDFPGPDDNEEVAKAYFANRFKKLNKNTDREIYIHFTNATDTTLLKNTMASVQDILIQKALNRLIL